MDSTTNLFGALALAVSDKIQTHMAEELNRSGESAAAIIFLGYTPGISVQILRQMLGLSHPGTVRLIDRLEEDGLVERFAADDRRAVALHLTCKGKRLRTRLMERRLNILETALETLSTQDRKAFGTLIAKVLASIPETEIDKHHICRLCSVDVCSNDCPIPGHADILEPFRTKEYHGA